MSQPLHSWARHPARPQQAHDLYWRDELAPRWQALQGSHGHTLAFGMGRSYGDSCLAASDQVLSMRGLDRLIAVDWQSGILRAEAGIRLADILALSIPRGWFLKVAPGTAQVTLGGAIANDVHGKNHHRQGCFGRHVRRFGLRRSDRGLLEVSASSEPELYAATIGGLGLTGIIEWAEIELLPIASTDLWLHECRYHSLDEFFALSREWDARHDYAVAWVDALARGPALGRGIYQAADFATEGRLEVARARSLRVPCTPPWSLVAPLSARAFNALYWRRVPPQARRRRCAYQPFFFPLDAIGEWHRIYGRAGFQQFQCVLPEAVAPAALRELLGTLGARAAGSFLAVLKRCGDLPSPGLLSFPRPGVSLALDFPHSPLLARELWPRLDAIVREAGGALYPAKDAHMSATDFQRAYPAWTQVEALRDPALLSQFWARVTR